MGSSMTDSNTLSEENRAVIEDMFIQLEQLSMDTVSLSLRIRCLIRDILDLRMAQWKEKEGKLKPGMLQKRGCDEDVRSETDASPWKSRRNFSPKESIKGCPRSPAGASPR